MRNKYHGKFGQVTHKGKIMGNYDNWLMSGAYDREDEEIYIEERVPELMD